MTASKCRGKHRCPIKGCRRQISKAFLLCATQWFQVPFDLRRVVMDAWANYSPDVIDTHEPLFDAQQDVIDFVNKYGWPLTEQSDG